MVFYLILNYLVLIWLGYLIQLTTISEITLCPCFFFIHLFFWLLFAICFLFAFVSLYFSLHTFFRFFLFNCIIKLFFIILVSFEQKRNEIFSFVFLLYYYSFRLFSLPSLFSSSLPSFLPHFLSFTLLHSFIHTFIYHWGFLLWNSSTVTQSFIFLFIWLLFFLYCLSFLSFFSLSWFLFICLLPLWIRFLVLLKITFSLIFLLHSLFILSIYL